MLSVSEISATSKTTRKVVSLIRNLLCAPIDKLRRRLGVGEAHACAPSSAEPLALVGHYVLGLVENRLSVFGFSPSQNLARE